MIRRIAFNFSKLSIYSRLKYSTYVKNVADFDGNNIAKYLLPIPPQMDHIFHRIRRIFMDPSDRVYPFVWLSSTRGQSKEYLNYFGLDHNNQTNTLLFLVLHVWVIHREMTRRNLDTLKYLLWEALWSIMKEILYQSGIDEQQFNFNLKEMQTKTLGFCLLFDGALEEIEKNGDMSDINNIIALYFYDKMPKLGSKHIDNFSKYIIIMESFVQKIPQKEFEFGAFVWPEFDLNVQLSD